eukprot:INCI18415.3.p1 GENE.INCI18415.3~~INCI18415.3.p1  ORF type:complete len:1335 (-),score=288.83 INCI18415.3:1148-5152(-)
MASSSAEVDNVEDLIFYYLRNDLNNHVRNLANKKIQQLKKSGNTDVLFFWKAVALIYQGDLDGAIKLFRKVKKKKSMELPASVGLIFAHKRQPTIDREAIKELEDFAKSALTRADLTALVAGARACMLTGNLTLGRQIAKRAGQRPDGVSASLSLSGWLEMYRASGPDLEAANGFFAKALAGQDSSNKSLDAMLGRVEYFKKKSQYAKALDIADEIIILFEWFKPRYTLKAELLVLASEWDLALETANRALSHNKKDIQALQVTIVYHLVFSGNYTEMDPSVRALEQYMLKLEPKNGTLYLSVTKCLGSLCGREEAVLRTCYRLMQKAVEEFEGSSEVALYLAECGKLALKLTEFAQAATYFQQASQANDSNPDVLLGLVESQVFQGKLTEASQQMEFLEAVADASNPNPLMVFLNALIVWRKRHNMDRQLKLLSQVVDLHLQNLKACGHPKNSVAWFVALDLDFLLQICQEYMQHCGTVPIMKSEAPPVACVQAEDILGRLVELVPGSLASKCLLAQCKFLVNDFETARFIIEKVIKCDKNFSRAQLLLARIYLFEENYALATSTLEAAIAASFEVRNMPIYYLIKAQVEKVSENVDGARVTLEAALELDGVRREVDGKHINIQDRCAVFVDLAEVYSILNLKDKAVQLILDAKNNFKGTTEESNITIAAAQLDRARGRVDKAIQNLSLILPESAAFVKARMTMAEMFLNDKRNEEKYVDCYQRIVDNNPGKTSLVIFGDALMAIQRPEDAIDAYEKAAELDPDDVDLATQIGEALVETHDFQNAIQYYKSALATGSGPKSAKIRHALASLYLKLGKFKSALRTLDDALDQSQQDAISEIQSLQNDVRSLLLLAEVHLGNKEGGEGEGPTISGNVTEALEVLHRARIVQNKVLAEVTDDDVASKVERKIASDIRFRLAKAFLLPGETYDTSKASEALNDAIKYDKEHTECIMELAKLCVKENDLANAQQHALKLLTIDENNVEASLMIADIMFRKTEYKAAVYHLQQMLVKTPNNYEVLARLVSVLWRSGTLTEAKDFLRRARRSTSRAIHDAGYNFCKGLYFALASDPVKAIHFLNLARRDGEWGRRAIERMILIYLNPTGVPMWEDSEEIREDAGEAIRVIESLLREAPMHPRTEYHEVLQCYSDMLTRSKSKIDQVAHTCLKINERNKNFVPALLCMATAFMLNKQIPKARNQLKRISKLPYDPEYASDFEDAYLMLSGIYIRTKKFDLALQLCKRCLEHNKSCGKAWEDMGLIMEKETSYKDAAMYYEKAWGFDCESSAPVGYKLAFNYLKAKEFIKAIDVCYKVLAKYPKYPKIRSDILERAQYFLRN